MKTARLPLQATEIMMTPCSQAEDVEEKAGLAYTDNGTKILDKCLGRGKGWDNQGEERK